MYRIAIDEVGRRPRIVHADAHGKQVHRSTERPSDDRIEKIRYARLENLVSAAFYYAVYYRKAQDRDRSCEIQFLLPSGIYFFFLK